MELNQTQMLNRLSKEINDISLDATHARADMTVAGSAIKVEDLKTMGDAIVSLVGEGRCLAQSQRVLQSLNFRSMEFRHTNIAPAHAKTFDWIFRPASQQTKSSRPVVHFEKWLSSKNGIFWVSGKPGSGKSTLMKHIAGHRQTRRTLELWAKPARCITAKYYFWSAGGIMQKSLKGLLQSLLFDILKQCPEIVPIACPAQVTSPKDQMEGDDFWDPAELSAMVQRITCCKDFSTKFCLFIDGLDEYEGWHFDIIKVLRNLAKSPNIKICISSRPWNVFEDAYGHDPTRKLYLQDLTRQDIKLYVKHRFEEVSSELLSASRDNRLQELFEEITAKAQGVFLWVLLVVNSLLEGLTNGDSISLLFSRLRRLPTDLEAFFGHMLRSIDDIYHEHMARSFQIALAASTPLTLMAYSFLDEELENGESALDRSILPMDNYELGSRHRQMRRRLNGRTKGLLEARQDVAGSNYFGYRVDFLHRTVHDFLRTKDMQDLLSSKTRVEFNPEISILRGYLALLKAMPLSERRVSDQPGPVQQLLEEAFFYARKIEIQAGSTCHELIDEFGAVIQSFPVERGKEFVWYRDSTVGDYDGVNDGTRTYACGSFFEYIIQKGLHIYVKQHLEREPTTKLPTGRPLLDCALRICPSKYSEETDLLDIVRYLLETGADPNEMYGTCSVWGRFLLQISNAVAVGTRRRPQDLTTVLHRHRLIELLIFHGADPNVMFDGSLVFGDYLISLASLAPSEEVGQMYLQTIDLFVHHGVDLCANARDDGQIKYDRSSVLDRFYLMTRRQGVTSVTEFQRRIWQHIMPLNERQNQRLRSPDMEYDAKFEYLGKIWRKRQQHFMGMGKRSDRDDEVLDIKASPGWAGMLWTWVWPKAIK